MPSSITSRGAGECGSRASVRGTPWAFLSVSCDCPTSGIGADEDDRVENRRSRAVGLVRIVELGGSGAGGEVGRGMTAGGGGIIAEGGEDGMGMLRGSLVILEGFGG